MFLLLIEKNKIKDIPLLQMTYVEYVSAKIKNKTIFFKKLKKADNIQSSRLLVSKTEDFKPYNFGLYNTVKYIIGITIHDTNIIIYLSDVKGTIISDYSTGTLKMNKNQKQKKISVLIKLIKLIIPEINAIPKKDRIALHLKNFNEHLSIFTFNFFFNHREIDILKIENTEPHNGCRPRKPKRKKTQRLNFG